MTKPRYKEFREHLLQKLKNPEAALAYLNEASRDEDQRVFLLALKNVSDAQGCDISTLSHDTQLSRQSVYKVLSEKGNPKLSSLKLILNKLGYEIALQPLKR